MELYCYSPSETFVALINLLGAMMACFNNRGRIATFAENKTRTFPMILRRNQSLHYCRCKCQAHADFMVC